MLFVTKIKMIKNQNYLENISELLIFDDSNNSSEWYKRQDIYNYVNKGGIIRVNIDPSYNKLVSVKNQYGTEYVRSSPNNSTKDDLLDLPKE